MKKNSIYKISNRDWMSFGLSFLIWLLPFVFRFFMEIPQIVLPDNESSNLSLGPNHEIVEKFLAKDSLGSFLLLFKNNFTVCLLLIFSGFLFCIGTIINLATNGFITADIIATSYQNGLDIDHILWTILPHSFELVGVWLSGAIGFQICYLLIKMVFRNEYPTTAASKHLVVLLVYVFVIILAAAFVEAYVSASFV